MWAPGFEQFEDQELPLVIWNQCAKVPRKRLGISLLGSAANVQHLGQPAEAPTETVERLGKALKTLQSTERFACDQHDHVSFVKAWMLLSRGVAHALDCDFRGSPLVMVPLQRRLENGQRQTMSALLEGDELAWERAKVPTCYGGLGTRATPLGFAARATYWSAFDLRKAVMPSICDALNRPIREVHPEATAALAVKADLLTVGVAAPSPWAADMEAAEVIRPALVQMTDNVPPKSVARDMHGPRRAAIEDPVCRCGCAGRKAAPRDALPQSNKLSCSVPEDRALVQIGQPCTSPRQRCYRTRNGGWPQHCDSVQRRMLAHAPRVP